MCQSQFSLAHACISNTHTIRRVSQLLTDGEYSYLLPFAASLEDIPLEDMQLGLLKSATRLTSLAVSDTNDSWREVCSLRALIKESIFQQLLHFSIKFKQGNAVEIINLLEKKATSVEVISSLEENGFKCELDINSKTLRLFLPKTNLYYYLSFIKQPVKKLCANGSETTLSAAKLFLESDPARFLEHLQTGFPHGVDFEMFDFKFLCEKCPNLTSLSIKTTAPIDEIVIESLRTLKNLRQIKLWIPEHSDTPTLEALQAHLPNLDMEHSMITQCRSS